MLLFFDITPRISHMDERRPINTYVSLTPPILLQGGGSKSTKYGYFVLFDPHLRLGGQAPKLNASPPKWISGCLVIRANIYCQDNTGNKPIIFTIFCCFNWKRIKSRLSVHYPSEYWIREKLLKTYLHKRITGPAYENDLTVFVCREFTHKDWRIMQCCRSWYLLTVLLNESSVALSWACLVFQV